MSDMVKGFFMFLSENKILNAGAKRWGKHLGAQRVVGGTTIDETIQTVKRLNTLGRSCTVDNLGEFVYKKDEVFDAMKQILTLIDAIEEEKVDAHISIKPSQLGLDINYNFCLSNIRKIVDEANKHNIFVNFDMENYDRLHNSFAIFDELSLTYDNIGIVIQAYFHRANNDIVKYKNFRLRLVKGAYKESEQVAYQDKDSIDRNYIELIEWHLLHGKFTSIATHDHRVIHHVKEFVKRNNISTDKFEFQMLYGFRENLQHKLVLDGYHFCTYVPFGDNWYGYFMRRLAERPQNLNLVVKQVFNKKTNTIIGLVAGAFILGRFINGNRQK